MNYSLARSKGKRKDNGEWAVGYYVCLNGKSHRIYTGYAETDCGDFFPDWHEVFPETVRNSTTRLDKNGVEIYENDILQTNGIYGCIIATMRFSDRAGFFKPYNKQYGFLNVTESQCEIIGNIHDNPELLKGGADNE